jgi:putative hydrolase of the HAD superfamily
MELNFRSDIKKWLDNTEKLEPIPTTFCPNLKTDSGEKIKAVIFDIYGTLLISSSGDIDQASLSSENLRSAMEAGGFDLLSCQPGVCTFLLDQLQEQIAIQHNQLHLQGHPFPDVDIFKVWEGMFEAAEEQKLLKRSGNESLVDTIFVFEILSNKVYPMPGMKEVLNALIKKGIPLGIVSNAQFYTPIIMNYFLTGEFSSRQDIELFDKDLSVFSFKELRAKPDTALFDTVKTTLENKYKIQASEAVFVGNDMLKDVYTATNSGLKTILFAGDERSLRLREKDARVKGMFPDFIINELSQLTKIID